MNKEEFMKLINDIPKSNNPSPISAYGSVSVEDICNAIDRLNKVPTYDELLKENERLKEENFNLREGIYIEKMSFPSEGRNFKELMEMPTYEELKKEIEKLNHYKLLYQKVKDRNDKAIEFIEELYDNTDDITCYEIDRNTRDDLLVILKGSNEEQ